MKIARSSYPVYLARCGIGPFALDGSGRPARAQRKGRSGLRADQQQQNPAPSQPPPPPAVFSSPAITIAVTVPVVNVDVVVTDNDGNYLSGLKKENFRITEDGAPQAITNFATGDAPITVVMLVEYSQLGYYSFLAERALLGRHLHPPAQAGRLGRARNPSPCAPTSRWISRTIPREIEQGLIQMVYPPFQRIESLRRPGRRDRPHARRQRQEVHPGARFGHRHLQPPHARQGASQGQGNRHHHLLRRRGRAADGAQPFRTAGITLHAGAESAQDLRRTHRRPRLVPAFRRRNSRHHGGRGRQPAQ